VRDATSWTQAIDCFEKVLKAFPKNYETRKILGSLYGVSDNKVKKAKGMQYLERVTREKPEDLEAWMELAKLKEQACKEEALKVCRCNPRCQPLSFCVLSPVYPSISSCHLTSIYRLFLVFSLLFVFSFFIAPFVPVSICVEGLIAGSWHLLVAPRTIACAPLRCCVCWTIARV
jgi:hypothetical protein